MSKYLIKILKFWSHILITQHTTLLMQILFIFSDYILKSVCFCVLNKNYVFIRIFILSLIYNKILLTNIYP